MGADTREDMQAAGSLSGVAPALVASSRFVRPSPTEASLFEPAQMQPVLNAII